MSGNVIKFNLKFYDLDKKEKVNLTHIPFKGFNVPNNVSNERIGHLGTKIQSTDSTLFSLEDNMSYYFTSPLL